MSNLKTGSESENLSRIRDILFGEDLQGIEAKLEFFKKENSEINESLKREFEERIAKIEKTIGDKNIEDSIIEKTNRILEKISELEKNLNQSLDNLKKEQEAKSEALNTNKVNKEEIATLLMELAEKLKQ